MEIMRLVGMSLSTSAWVDGTMETRYARRLEQGGGLRDQFSDNFNLLHWR